MAESNDAGSSAGDWVREAANSFVDSLVPEGFEYVAEYGMYYSRTTGYYFDTNTRLYYHPSTDCYYEYKEETGEFVTRQVFRPGKWSRKWKKRARGVFGKEGSKKLDQEGVDVAEAVFRVVAAVVAPEVKEDDLEAVRARHQKQMRRAYAMHNTQQYDEEMGISYRLHDERKPVQHDDGASTSSGASSEEEDERAKLFEEERMHEAPCIRFIDESARLHIVTMHGGFLGTGLDCDVRIEDLDPYVAEKHISIVYDAEAGHYRLEVLSERGVVLVDDQPLQKTKEKAVIIVPSRETQRRRQLKMLKSMWSINDYAESSTGGGGGYTDRARARRAEIGSVHPAEKRGRAEDGIYAGCAARPVPGATAVQSTTTSMAVPLSTENKGFKLLKSMGWKEGEGLGKESGGRVRTELKNNRTGLGHNKEPLKTAKQKILDKTRERFQQIRD